MHLQFIIPLFILLLQSYKSRALLSNLPLPYIDIGITFILFTKFKIRNQILKDTVPTKTVIKTHLFVIWLKSKGERKYLPRETCLLHWKKEGENNRFLEVSKT